MKSIGIITIHNSKNNYGGVLQSFGLFEYLRSQGYAVEVIDLHRPNTHPDYVMSPRYTFMRFHVSLVQYAKARILEILGKRHLFDPKVGSNWNPDAVKKFNDFNDRIKLSRPYTYIPDLYKNPPKYDAYISGSDQLWNPTQPYCLEPYFLTFVKDSKALKLSYGTSIGITDLFDQEKKQFKKWLSSYDVISVREQQATDLLREITDRDITRVPDPTFLLDPEQWISIAEGQSKHEKYILVFSLGKNYEIVKKAIQLAESFSCKVKVIDQNYAFPLHDNVEPVTDAGPLDFIGLIRDAYLVLTDSFHCTVFSLITGTRNFYTYISPDSDRGSRIVDLLKVYGLENHIVNYLSDIPGDRTLSDEEIHTAKTYSIMKRERQSGRTFLKDALSIKK